MAIRLSGFFLLLLLVLPRPAAYSCGYQPPPFEGYTLISRHLLDFPYSRPFYFNIEGFAYQYTETVPEAQKRENLRDWQQYFKKSYELADIEQLVYQAYEEHLLDLSERKPLPDSLLSNPLLANLQRQPDKELLDYLRYAKRCEPFAVIGGATDGWDAPDTDPASIKALTDEGAKAYRGAKSSFLKLRYGYQLVRLAHYYGGNPASAYDKYVKPLEKVPSVIRYWALGHKAGYLTQREKADQRLEGNYLLARVVLHSPGRQRAHWLSFNIRGDQEWTDVMKRCQTNSERATLHYIRALDTYSIALEEMEAMYRLDPNYPHFPVLLVREIQKLEASLLRDHLQHRPELEDSFRGIPEVYAQDYLDRLRAFVNKVVREKRSRQATLWQGVQAYLAFMAQDYAQARTGLQQALSTTADTSLLHDQLEVFDFALALELAPRIDQALEERLGNLLTDNRAMPNDLTYGTLYHYDSDKQDWMESQGYIYNYESHNYLLQKLAERYLQQGELGKAYLSLYSIQGLKYYPDVATARAVLAFYDKADKNSWENYLMKKENEVDRAMLLDIIGTALVAKDSLAKAEAVFAQVKTAGPLIPDPFRGRLADHRSLSDKNVQQFWTKYDLTREVRRLKDKIVAHPEQADSLHLKLGHYYYNTSYWGHAWRAKDYFISLYDPTRSQPLTDPLAYYMDYANGYHYLGARGNLEQIDLAPAEQLYRQAARSKNPDIAAEALFMLAKCAHQRDVLELGHYGDPDFFWRRNEYFYQLLQRYPEAEFTRYALRECETFRAFSQR